MRLPNTAKQAISKARWVSVMVSLDGDIDIPVQITKQRAYRLLQKWGHNLTVCYDERNGTAWFDKRSQYDGSELHIFSVVS